MEKLEEIWNEFDQVQTAVEMKVDLTENITYHTDFEDLYFKALVEANKVISLLRVEVANSEQGSVAVASDSRSTRGCSMAPVFNEDYLEWASFYDDFTFYSVNTHKH